MAPSLPQPPGCPTTHLHQHGLRQLLPVHNLDGNLLAGDAVDPEFNQPWGSRLKCGVLSAALEGPFSTLFPPPPCRLSSSGLNCPDLNSQGSQRPCPQSTALPLPGPNSAPSDCPLIHSLSPLPDCPPSLSPLPASPRLPPQPCPSGMPACVDPPVSSFSTVSIVLFPRETSLLLSPFAPLSSLPISLS